MHVRQELAVHQNTTAGTSEATSMKPYQVIGYDEEVVLSIPPRSPDLSPPEFCLWASLKDM
jgi:hypothetical protein